MYARKRLDISYADIGSGLFATLFTRDPAPRTAAIERWFSADPAVSQALVTLSVRTGFDLYLRALDLPRGSEVLCSALTIPDMGRVIDEHGLVPVPIDIDPATLAPRMECLRRALTPRTKLILIAHIFGTRTPLAPYASFAREHGLLLLEDDAQAFTDYEFKGDPDADVCMFSFGPIKTATALQGGVLVVKDRAVLERMRTFQASYPVASSRAYAARLCKYAGLKLVSTRLGYSAFVGFCHLRGKSHDAAIQSSVRGFGGGDFWEKLRHRPSAALCALLARRLRQADGRRVQLRTEKALRLRARLGTSYEIPGGAASIHSYWVFTILADEPERVVAALAEAGFDATRVATMKSVPAPAGQDGLAPREALALLDRLIYLPVYPELSERSLERLASVLLVLRRPARSQSSDPAQASTRASARA